MALFSPLRGVLLKSGVCHLMTDPFPSGDSFLIPKKGICSLFKLIPFVLRMNQERSGHTKRKKGSDNEIERGKRRGGGESIWAVELLQ